MTTNAEDLYMKFHEYKRLESNLWDFLQDEVIQLDLDHMPFDDVGWDWYDNSLEIYGCSDEFIFTPIELEKIWNYGFDRIYVNCPSQGKYYQKGLKGYGDCSTRPERDYHKQLKNLRLENEKFRDKLERIEEALYLMLGLPPGGNLIMNG